MDKTIHKHLDNKDDLLEKVKKDIERFQGSLDLDAVLEDPEEALLGFAEAMATEVIGRHAQSFVREGQRFAQDVIKKRTPVVVEDSKDPHENKEEFENA